MECEQRFIHKNIHQIHVCKSNILLTIVEVADEYRGSLHYSIHFCAFLKCGETKGLIENIRSNNRNLNKL